MVTNDMRIHILGYMASNPVARSTRRNLRIYSKYQSKHIVHSFQQMSPLLQTRYQSIPTLSVPIWLPTTSRRSAITPLTLFATKLSFVRSLNHILIRISHNILAAKFRKDEYQVSATKETRLIFCARYTLDFATRRGLWPTESYFVETQPRFE